MAHMWVTWGHARFKALKALGFGGLGFRVFRVLGFSGF